MRDTFVRTLIDLAGKNKNIELLTGDLGFGVLKPYWEQLPEQFTNMGIAEQNMTSVAAGMALNGKTVFTYSIGNFPTLRCLEQIRNDCAYHQANVKIVCVGGGFAYGALGMSHHATEDIAVMRALPEVAVMCPGDKLETEAATRAITQYAGTCYLRLGRGGERQIQKNLDDFQIGKAVKVKDYCGAKPQIAVFSTGAILEEVTEACLQLDKLRIGNLQYSFPTVKPLDKAVINECIMKVDLIVTVEEHNINGGFGSAVAEVMAEYPKGAGLLRIGIEDNYWPEAGSQHYLRDKFGINREQIVEKIIKLRGNYAKRDGISYNSSL